MSFITGPRPLKTLLPTLLILAITFSTNANEIGTFMITKKQVTVERQKQEINVKRRYPQFKLDVVKTGVKAKAQFRLIDGTLFSLGEQSELHID